MTEIVLKHGTIRRIFDRLKVNKTAGTDGIQPIAFRKHAPENAISMQAVVLLRYRFFPKMVENR